MAENKAENKEKKTSPEQRAKETEGGLKGFFDHAFLPGIGFLAGVAGNIALSAGALMISLLDKGKFKPHFLSPFFKNTFNF